VFCCLTDLSQGRSNVELVFRGAQESQQAMVILADRDELRKHCTSMPKQMSHLLESYGEQRRIVFTNSTTLSNDCKAMVSFLSILHMDDPAIEFSSIRDVLHISRRLGCPVPRRRIDRWLARQLRNSHSELIVMLESNAVVLESLMSAIMEYKLKCTLMVLPKVIVARLLDASRVGVEAWQHALELLPQLNTNVAELNFATRRLLVQVARDQLVDGDALCISSEDH
jgi:hypothetical protein